MIIYLMLGVIIALLYAILNALKYGFNEVVTGLRALYDAQHHAH